MTDAVFDIDAKAVYYTLKLAQHYFGLNTDSSAEDPVNWRKIVILISSLAGYLELNDVDYTAAKWAVRGMFRAARSMMEDLGFRTNLIAPWIIDTPMSSEFAKGMRAQGVPVGEIQGVVDAIVRCAADGCICG